MGTLKGIAAVVYMTLNAAMVWVVLAFWIVQLTWTRGEKRRALKQRMDYIIIWWTGNNRHVLRWLNILDAEVTWHEHATMSKDAWYLVISNHQSWTDIIVLQSVLFGTIPPLKFFTKDTLIWIPFIGLAMKVLGFPYVKRATKDQIRANPALRTADRDNTLAACEGFKNHPTSILNFVEGTRRTPEKYARQNGEFKYLLRPKIGGLGYVLEGMSDHLSELLDVTIIYPHGVPTFWAFLKGESPNVEVHIRPHPIPHHIFEGDEHQRRAEIAQWIKGLWLEKDAHIAPIMNGDSAPGG